MKWNNLLVAIVGVVAFLLGMCATVIIKKGSNLTLDPTVSFEINPFEPIVLLATLLLGLYVAKTIAKENNTEVVQKNIMINRLNGFEQQLTHEIHKVISKDSIALTSVLMKCKALRTRLASLSNVAIKSNFFEENDLDLVQAKSLVRDLWEIMTDSTKEGVNVEHNQITYSDSVKQEIDTKIINIQEKILEILFKLK